MTGQLPIQYRVFGNGPNALLAFHGIGQEAQVFEQLTNVVDSQYTIFSIDLPFHGESLIIDYQSVKSQEPDIISKNIWTKNLERFLVKVGIDRFSVMGYSMGGRFALATVEAFAQRIDSLFLLAPDGITEDPFYVLATRLKLTRKIFRWVAFEQAKFEVLGRFLVKIRLMPASNVRFAQAMLDTPAKQAQVYASWVCFRDFRFDIEHIVQLIQQEQIQLSVFLGRYDKILPLKHVNPLCRHFSDKNLIVLNSGHTQLIAKVREHFENSL
jgi:pimeloyl-ACP methyl ester carboxylesterase